MSRGTSSVQFTSRRRAILSSPSCARTKQPPAYEQHTLGRSPRPGASSGAKSRDKSQHPVQEPLSIVSDGKFVVVVHGGSSGHSANAAQKGASSLIAGEEDEAAILETEVAHAEKWKQDEPALPPPTPPTSTLTTSTTSVPPPALPSPEVPPLQGLPSS